MTAKKAVVVPTLAEIAAEGSDAQVLLAAEDVFTRERALAIDSPEAATAYASEALTAWTAAERMGKRVSVFAAITAAVAVREGLLCDGPKPKDAADTVRDSKEWGAAWITPAHPEGVSRQMVDTWIRAGEAFLGWGLDPDSSEGRRLVGGLAQSKEWNAERKVLAAAIDEARESGEVTDEAIAEMVTERVADIRETVETLAREKAATKAAEKAEAERKVREALVSKTTASVSAPEALADRATMVEQIIAGLRPAIKAERELLQSIADRALAALAQHDEDVAASA